MFTMAPPPAKGCATPRPAPLPPARPPRPPAGREPRPRPFRGPGGDPRGGGGAPPPLRELQVLQRLPDERHVVRGGDVDLLTRLEDAERVEHLYDGLDPVRGDEPARRDDLPARPARLAVRAPVPPEIPPAITPQPP